MKIELSRNEINGVLYALDYYKDDYKKELMDIRRNINAQMWFKGDAME
jgi:hypothetical protein